MRESSREEVLAGIDLIWRWTLKLRELGQDNFNYSITKDMWSEWVCWVHQCHISWLTRCVVPSSEFKRNYEVPIEYVCKVRCLCGKRLLDIMPTNISKLLITNLLPFHDRGLHKVNNVYAEGIVWTFIPLLKTKWDLKCSIWRKIVQNQWDARVSICIAENSFRSFGTGPLHS